MLSPLYTRARISMTFEPARVDYC